jgi:hypothetical protein
LNDLNLGWLGEIMIMGGATEQSIQDDLSNLGVLQGVPVRYDRSPEHVERLIHEERTEISDPDPQKLVDGWNEKYEVGQAVTVRMDSGELRRTRTRSRAQLLSGHTGVIWVEDISGCYLLERVQAV